MYPDLGHSAIYHCFRNQITFTRKFTIHLSHGNCYISQSFFVCIEGITVSLCYVMKSRSPEISYKMYCTLLDIITQNVSHGLSSAFNKKYSSRHEREISHLLIINSFLISSWGCKVQSVKVRGWGQTSLPSEVSATPAVTSDLQDTQLLICHLSFSHCCHAATHAVYPKRPTVASVHTFPSWVVPAGPPTWHG